MLRAWCLGLGMVVGLGCVGAPRPLFDAPLRYVCRVDVAPLREALRAAGGDATRLVVVQGLGDLMRLTAGQRYKFVLRTTGALVVAPLPEAHPGNEYVHPILGDGAPVWTAGGLTVDHADGRVRSVTLDARSGSYCTATESLVHAVRALRALGLADAAIAVQGRPLLCMESASPTPH